MIVLLHFSRGACLSQGKFSTVSLWSKIFITSDSKLSVFVRFYISQERLTFISESLSVIRTRYNQITYRFMSSKSKFCCIFLYSFDQGMGFSHVFRIAFQNILLLCALQCVSHILYTPQSTSYPLAFQLFFFSSSRLLKSLRFLGSRS